MLRKLRIILATVFITALTLLFLDYTGAVHAYLGGCAKVQFIPALFALNAVIIVALALMTLLLGRIYCSIICPLGIFQDVMSWLTHFGGKDRSSYRPRRKALVAVRYSLLVIFILAAALHVPAVTALIEPYSAYGRMISQIFGPLYQWGNNLLAHFAERAGSYAFYTVDVWLRGVAALTVAVSTFAVISVFAWKSWRGYCNGICPVGAILGLLSNFSLMKPRIDKGKCGNCSICIKNCKAACINPGTLEIDYTRCVTCFNCVELCPRDAVLYSAARRAKRPPAGNAPDTRYIDVVIGDGEGIADNLAGDSASRRNLLTGAALLLFGLAARPAARLFDGGLAHLEPKRSPPRKRPVLPPGAGSVKNFGARCTGCQLCVTVCPNHILRPSGKMSEFMQPHVSFERGYCRPECVKCSEVCPTGAIRPITAAEKSATQTGIALWRPDLCIVNRDGSACDLCERKCPTGAIKRIPQSADDPSSPKVPMIDTARCTGCGACEHLCPARPDSAIYVDGVEVHRII